MVKEKWLRVRLTDEQDQKLEHYAVVCGLSRSDLIREIIEDMPNEPTRLKPNFQRKINKKKKLIKSFADSLGNNYLLSVEYKVNFYLWRITLHQIGKQNQDKSIAEVDLVKETLSDIRGILLNSIILSSTETSEEIIPLIWETIKQLASQEGWDKLYGELTLDQIENKPQCLSWLKKNGFTIISHPEQKTFNFSLIF